jgi:hypothetical protein
MTIVFQNMDAITLFWEIDASFPNEVILNRINFLIFV